MYPASLNNNINNLFQVVFVTKCLDNLVSISSSYSQKILTQRDLFFLQKCDAGFFRAVSGECLPCDCNGNSGECLDGSGVCMVRQQHLSPFTYFADLCLLDGDKTILEVSALQAQTADSAHLVLFKFFCSTHGVKYFGCSTVGIPSTKGPRWHVCECACAL